MSTQADCVMGVLSGLASQVGEGLVPSKDVEKYLRWLSQQAKVKPKDYQEMLKNVWTVMTPDGPRWFGEAPPPEGA